MTDVCELSWFEDWPQGVVDDCSRGIACMGLTRTGQSVAAGKGVIVYFKASARLVLNYLIWAVFLDEVYGFRAKSGALGNNTGGMSRTGLQTANQYFFFGCQHSIGNFASWGLLRKLVWRQLRSEGC